MTEKPVGMILPCHQLNSFINVEVVLSGGKKVFKITPVLGIKDVLVSIDDLRTIVSWAEK